GGRPGPPRLVRRVGRLESLGLPPHAEHRRDDVGKSRDRFAAADLLRPNPPVLDTLPIEAHAPARGVEEEGVDDEHRGAVAGMDRGRIRTKPNSSEAGLLSHLSDRAGFRILAAFDGPRNDRPATAKGPNRWTSSHEEDPTAVSQHDGDDGSCADPGELDGPTVPVDSDRVAVLQAPDVDVIDHRDSGENRADRDDSLGRKVDDARGADSPLREAVDDVRANRAPFAVREREDPAVEAFVGAACRGIEDGARGRPPQSSGPVRWGEPRAITSGFVPSVKDL